MRSSMKGQRTGGAEGPKRSPWAAQTTLDCGTAAATPKNAAMAKITVLAGAVVDDFLDGGQCCANMPTKMSPWHSSLGAQSQAKRSCRS